jgi:Zn-dependent protease with chaperone function
MPLRLLVLLILACLLQEWPEPGLVWLGCPANKALFVVLTWSGVALVGAVAAALGRQTCWELAHHPEDRDGILHRYGQRRFCHLLGLFVFFVLDLYVLGWGWTVFQLFPYPGSEVLNLAPLVAVLALSWAGFYDADRALHDTSISGAAVRPFWSRSAYVGFHLRQNLGLLLAPLLLMVAEKTLQRAFPEEDENAVVVATAIGLPLAVFIALPWFLRLAWGLKPLPAGALRDRLLAAASRLRFRFSNVLLWDTNGGVANAMVAGVLPCPRYVLLSDRLIQDLSPDEVEAVFGHEVGHVKYHHILFYVTFLMASFTAVAWLWSLLIPASLSQGSELWAKLPLVGIVCVYIFLVFGFLSRRCERQADIFGCRAVSCGRPDCDGHDPGVVLLPGGRGLCPTGIRTFIEALEKVAQLNNISRSRPGWLQSWWHSTIARRVEFLQRMLADPTLERRFQRTVGLVKWGLVLALAALLLGLGLLQGWDNATFLL